MTYWVIGKNVGQGIRKFYLTPVKSGIHHLISREAITLSKYILIYIVITCFILILTCIYSHVCILKNNYVFGFYIR